LIIFPERWSAFNRPFSYAGVALDFFIYLPDPLAYASGFLSSGFIPDRGGISIDKSEY